MIIVRSIRSDLINGRLIEWPIYIIRTMLVSIKIRVSTTSETVVGDTEVHHQGHGPVMFARYVGRSMSPQWWPRFLTTCRVFTVCCPEKVSKLINRLNCSARREPVNMSLRSRKGSQWLSTCWVTPLCTYCRKEAWSGCHAGQNGGDDHEDESRRSSLVNHKSWRSLEKEPSQVTKRDVVVWNTGSLVTSLKVTPKPPSSCDRWWTMCDQTLIDVSHSSEFLWSPFSRVSTILQSTPSYFKRQRLSRIICELIYWSRVSWQTQEVGNGQSHPE